MEIDFSRLLLENSPDAFVALTAEGRVLHWSRAAQEMFGYTSHDACGQLLAQLVVPPGRDLEDQRFLGQTIETGSATYESIRKRQDGSLICVAVSSRIIPTTDGSPVNIIITMKDMTQLKVQRDAKLVDARYREILEAMPDGIIMVNATGRIVYSNTQAERLFGYDVGQLRGQLIELLLPDRFRAGHIGHRANFFNQPRTRPMGAGLELYGRRQDGTEFPIEISLSPLETEEGTLVSSAIRDITERKRFDRALQEKNLELAAANQAKDRFLASMSHELRTPLNAIIGFTGTMLMKLPGPLNAEQQRQLRTVQLSATHLLALINDLLDVAKIEAGKRELELVPLDVGLVLTEVTTTLRPQAEDKGLSLTLILPAAVAIGHLDRRALSQIVLNLVTNAIKFTDHGGITISLEQGDAGTIDIRVADTGIGIRPADQTKLFEAFSRVGADKDTQKEGTGLGLHLSQKLAQQMGGRITLHSTYGRGSTFILTLTKVPS